MGEASGGGGAGRICGFGEGVAAGVGVVTGSGVETGTAGGGMISGTGDTCASAVEVRQAAARRMRMSEPGA